MIDQYISIFNKEKLYLKNPNNKNNFIFYQKFNLKNHFLISMPLINNPIFYNTVIYICEHNKNGAFGVIINKSTDIKIDILLNKINFNIKKNNRIIKSKLNKKIMLGGTIEVNKGFILHKKKKKIFLKTSKKILNKITNKYKTKEILISLGYSGWNTGQLENEVKNNMWLTVKADHSIIFNTPIKKRFNAALSLLGINKFFLNKNYYLV